MSERTVESYRDLKVWQAGMEIGEHAYRLSRSFPKEELFGFTSQIRRASASVPANIAEGYGRQSKGEYIQFLRIAQGSLKELETHLMLAVRVGITTDEAIQPLMAVCDAEGRMLQSLIKALSSRTPQS
jgi:four helix bundle protein